MKNSSLSIWLLIFRILFTLGFLHKILRFKITNKFLIYLQSVNSNQRTICGVYVEGELVERDLTYKIGLFSPFQLVYFSNVRELDISGCSSINNSDFVDCVAFIKYLKCLNMSYCRQFSEGQVVKICRSHPKLLYFNFTGGSLFLFKSAFLILIICRQMNSFNVEVRFPIAERRDWRKLKQTFRQVFFGRSISDVI